MADRTITLDSSDIVYTDRHMLTHTIKQDETFGVGFVDNNGGGYYSGGHSTFNSAIVCTDGFRLNVIAEKTFFNHSADGALVDTGSIWFREDDGSENEWRIRSMTIADADGAGDNNITTAVLERADKPMITMTWTLEKIATS